MKKRKKKKKKRKGLEKTRVALGLEGEVVEGGGGDLEASGGGPDLIEAVLEEIDLQIGLLL